VISPFAQGEPKGVVMRYLVLVGVVLCVMAMVARSSRSDPPEAGSGSSASATPPTSVHAPFTPYDNGGSAAAFAYGALDASNQAYVDNLPNYVSSMEGPAAAFAAAAAQGAARAHAQAAGNELGVQNLARQGVVP